MSIVAFILSITFFFSFIGLILAIVDFAVNKRNKHGFSVAALIIGGLSSLIMMIFIIVLASSGTSANSSSYSNSYSQSSKSPAEIKEEYINQCRTFKYEDVARQPDNYKGRKTRIEGTVVQVMEGDNNLVNLRIATSANGFEDIWYIVYYRSSGESRILENDYVIVYGDCEGVISYETVWGNSLTIPAITGKYIEIQKQPET